MPIPAIAIALGYALAGAIAQQAVNTTTDTFLSPIAAKARETLEKRLKTGKYGAIQKALEGARQDLLAQAQTDQQRLSINEVLDAMLNSGPGVLLSEFSAQVTQVYLLPGSSGQKSQAFAKSYRKACGPVAIVKREVLDEATLTALLQAFFLAFRERLLQDPDFDYLRQYSQFVEERKQTGLQQEILDRLDAIAASLAKPVEDFNPVRLQYCQYLINALKDHTIRGFAPQVRGRVVSLPLADIFLPLQSVEGRPALAEYAEEDLRRQAASEVIGELDWQRRRDEMEKRYVQLSAKQAAQRSLSLADLLKGPRSVLLGDPGTGKTTVTEYITYALASDDLTHLGPGVRGLVPVLIRIANYAKAYERDATLHVIEYVEKELTSRSEFGRYLRCMIESGDCLIILDGLDEVTDPSLRIQVTERIQQMVAGFDANRFLVTSRIVGYDRSPLTSEFRHATLKELTSTDQERFVRLWYEALREAIGEGSRTEGGDDLVEALRTKPQIARMAANPLLLTIIVLMHWRGFKLPNRRVQVYESATNTMIEYWTQQRGVELDAEDVKAILAPIAYYVLSSSVGGVIAHQDLLPRFFSGIEELRGLSSAEAKQIGRELLKDLNEQSGLFLERGRDINNQPVYGFLHQTFGEYLAALHLAQLMLGGSFILGDFIHRSMWYEPLLLMAGHLSIVSPTHTNVLIRNILDLPSPYDDVLQRNTLLAAECLADDVQVKPDLRDEVLEKLATLLMHPALQVRATARSRYEHLAKSRCCEPALAALKRIIVQLGDELNRLSFDATFSIASALVSLGDKEAAWPLMQAMERSEDWPEPQAQRLRFEGWVEQAADYLLELQADRRSYFGVSAGPDIARCTLGPVSAELALRILGLSQLLLLLQELANRINDPDSRTTLRWIAVLASGEPPIEVLVDLAGPDVVVEVRCLAAIRLLESDRRSFAVEVLRSIVETEHTQAPAAAQALLVSGEASQLNWSLMRDLALLPSHEQAPQAIATLLQARDESCGLSAAFHFLAFCQTRYSNRDLKLWSVVESLLKYDRSELGQAAARWLALRPGFTERYEACEALIKAGCIRDTIPLLQYVAYECHSEDGQRACRLLLVFHESERVVPLLTCVAKSGSSELKYQASLALALGNCCCAEDEPSTRIRLGLKLAILSERIQAYDEALHQFCQIGLGTLEGIKPVTDQESTVLGLGRYSLRWLAQSVSATAEMDAVEGSSWPVLRLNAALSALRVGRVDRARMLLSGMLTMKPGAIISVPVRSKVVERLGGLVSPQTVSLILRALGDEDDLVRCSAADVLGSLGDPAAVSPLIVALGDEDDSVRLYAAHALGSLGDSAAVSPLIAALGDEGSSFRGSAANALGRLGDPAAISPLIVALCDEDSSVRASAANALGSLGNPAAVPSLITALGDEDDWVRRSVADALGSLGDPAAVLPLIAALGDEDDWVRSSAANALRSLGDPAAVPSQITALSDEGDSVRSVAALALGSLGDSSVVSPLIAALSDEDYWVRCSAADALGSLGDPDAVPSLIVALGDEDERVRCFAADALGSLGDPVAVSPLITALGDEDGYVRSFAAKALGRLGEAAAVSPLIAALGDEDDEVRRYAANALGSLGDPVAVLPLITALGDEDDEVRRYAAKALGRLGEAAAVSLLIAALDDQSYLVPSFAADALGRLGAPDAIRPLIAALSGEDDSLRDSAAEALARLGVSEASAVIEAISAAAYSTGAISYARALIHLNPTKALTVLARYGQQFRQESWVTWFRGYALWRLGDLEEALASFKQAEARESKDTANLLALAHFYIEQDDPSAAENYVHRAVSAAPREAICQLSRAVLLWQMGNTPDALSALRKAQKIDRQIAKVKDLQYEYFWGSGAVAALQAMLACA